MILLEVFLFSIYLKKILIEWSALSHDERPLFTKLPPTVIYSQIVRIFLLVELLKRKWIRVVVVIGRTIAAIACRHVFDNQSSYVLVF